MPTPTTDFSVFDGQEVVTYTPVSGPAVEDVPAMRRPLTQSRQRNVECYVELEVTDVIFYLEGTLLESAVLAAGDALTDGDSVLYEVIFVERQTLGNAVAAVGRPAV